MKVLLSISFFLCITAQAQVFKSPADAKVSAANKDSMLFITGASVRQPLAFTIPDTIPRPIWKTTMSPDRIVSASLMLSKADGSIIIIDSAWKMNVRKEVDRIAVIYPDSTRVIYRVADRNPKDTLITIPFEISKKRFDAAQNIKLEIIR